MSCDLTFYLVPGDNSGTVIGEDPSPYVIIVLWVISMDCQLSAGVLKDEPLLLYGKHA